MRCADSDRELVATLLNTAYAEGRITREEHDERLDATWAARTFAELEQLTADITPATASMPVPAGERRGVVVDPSQQNPQADSLVTVMGTVRREGSWRLRRRTTGLVVMGDAKLDLRGATLEAQECVISLPVLLGDVKITIPDGIAVRDETTTVMGDVKIRGVRPAPPGAPVVVLRGLVLMGDVKVLGPDHVPLGRRLGLS
ncbi:hypothetical protein GCM10009599_05770 [Luteococcus peritonei]